MAAKPDDRPFNLSTDEVRLVLLFRALFPWHRPGVLRVLEHHARKGKRYTKRPAFVAHDAALMFR